MKIKQEKWLLTSGIFHGANLEIKKRLQILNILNFFREYSINFSEPCLTVNQKDKILSLEAQRHESLVQTEFIMKNSFSKQEEDFSVDESIKLWLKEMSHELIKLEKSRELEPFTKFFEIVFSLLKSQVSQLEKTSGGRSNMCLELEKVLFVKITKSIFGRQILAFFVTPEYFKILQSESQVAPDLSTTDLSEYGQKLISKFTSVLKICSEITFSVLKKLKLYQQESSEKSLSKECYSLITMMMLKCEILKSLSFYKILDGCSTANRLQDNTLNQDDLQARKLASKQLEFAEQKMSYTLNLIKLMVTNEDLTPDIL